MRGARSLPLAAGVLSNLRRGGEKAYAAHCICAVHYGKWQLKWVCAIKNFGTDLDKTKVNESLSSMLCFKDYF